MTRAKSAIAALGVVGYLLVPYRWAVRARAGDEASARRMRVSVAAVDTRVDHARTVARDRAEWARRVARVQATFPSTIDVSGEVAQLRAIAESTGARLASITSDPPVSTAPRAEAPRSIELRLQLQGPVTAIEAFLTRLRAAPRLFTITRTALDFGTDPRGPVTVDLSTEVWTWP